MKKLSPIILALISVTGFAQQTRITFYAPGIVRVERTDGGFRDGESYSVIMQPEDVRVRHTTRGNVETYVSSELKLVVENGRIMFCTKSGRPLLREDTATFEPITEGPDKGAFRVSQGWTPDAGEPIYGLGMLQNGKLNQRGENRRMIQSNTEDYANFFQSLKGYGIFWDNCSPTTVSDDGSTLTLASEVAREEDYYFIYGGNADGVVSSLRKLTGKVPMLPLWTYGYHQSRERYRSQKELLDVVEGYRNAGIPLDGIIQDWQYWGNNYLWNAMEFLNETFPDPKAMIDRTHALGAHMSISIWQSFGPQTIPYRQLDEKGLLFDYSTWPTSGLSSWPPRLEYPSGVRLYDAYSPEARDIYWNNLKRLYDLGIDAWWMDSTDPDHFGDAAQIESDLDKPTSAGTFRSVRNAYPLLAVEGIYDHQRAEASDKRVFILTRSYFTGQQRTGANTWSGDTQSGWDSYRNQIPLCLNCTLTGNPNVNSDIGGFFPGPYNKPGQSATCSRNPLFQELYVRWLQFGAFNPMMRSHGESSRREIWEFGKPGDPVYEAIAASIRLRYSLLPYIYSTSWQVSVNDDSFMRPLVMDFPLDTAVWNMPYEFLFGRSLLVAPVTDALYTSEERRWSEDVPDWSEPRTAEVYLPRGSKWYDWYTARRYDGGMTVTAGASLDRCPLFVRAGSIIPLGPDVQYASEKPWDELEIRVYAGADGRFTLYEDEGDNYNYLDGAYSTIDFIFTGNTLVIGERKGSFEGMLRDRRFNVKFISPSGERSVTVEYDGTRKVVR